MNKIYRCLKCGWEKDTIEDLDLECPLCKSDLQIEISDENIDNNVATNLENALDVGLVISMETNIKELGHNKCWEIIEDISNPLTRIEYRKLFISAGGEVPEKEIKI